MSTHLASAASGRFKTGPDAMARPRWQQGLQRWAAPLVLVVAASVSGGCAGLNTVTSEVSSFGEWPAERKPSTYAFDRLPSQQAQEQATAALEAAAQGALAKAGFKPAAAGAPADVLVQVGSRLDRTAQGVWADPLWWRGGFGLNYGLGRPGPWVGPWGVPAWQLQLRADALRWEREVAVLIRDRASGKPLFEARAQHDDNSRGDAKTVAAMFEAALMDFPKLGVNPRRVVVTLAP